MTYSKLENGQLPDYKSTAKFYVNMGAQNESTLKSFCITLVPIAMFALTNKPVSDFMVSSARQSYFITHFL